MRVLAIQFLDALPPAPAKEIEDLRVSVFHRAITSDSVAVLIEHLRDYVGADSEEKRSVAARCLAGALADDIEDAVTQSCEYAEWDAERFAPCDMDLARARR